MNLSTKVWPEVCSTSGLNPSSSVLRLQSCGLHVSLRVVIFPEQSFIYLQVLMWNLFLSWWCWKINNVSGGHGTFISHAFRQRKRGEPDNPAHAISFFSFTFVTQMSPLWLIESQRHLEVWNLNPPMFSTFWGGFCFQGHLHPKSLAFLSLTVMLTCRPCPLVSRRYGM